MSGHVWMDLIVGVRGRVAYRMVGSLSEADEAVQEAWLRLAGTGDDEIENLAGWRSGDATSLAA